MKYGFNCHQYTYISFHKVYFNEYFVKLLHIYSFTLKIKLVYVFLRVLEVSGNFSLEVALTENGCILRGNPNKWVSL